MPALPIQLNIAVAAGSQWTQGYQILNDADSSLMNLTGATFELVIRPATTDTTQPPLLSVTSATATVQGYITVTLATSTILVVLSPTATALLGAGARPYSLWMNPGLTGATGLVVGTCFSSPVAAP